MTQWLLRCGFVGMIVALSAAPALADKPEWAGGGPGRHGGPPGEERGHGHSGQPSGKSDAAVPNGRFMRDEVVIVRRYFEHYPMQPAALPPGIAKKLARGKPLPPGIAKQLAPVELRQRIPVCMTGWECVLVGADLLILDAVHGTIQDILRGVVR